MASRSYRGQQPPTLDQDTDIDWERVASRVRHFIVELKVNVICVILQVNAPGNGEVQRTATECEIRWRGSFSPKWNHTMWSQAETARVRELVGTSEEGEIDWVDIARRLGVRNFEQ